MLDLYQSDTEKEIERKKEKRKEMNQVREREIMCVCE